MLAGAAVATATKGGVQIMGLNGHPIEDVTLENIRLSYNGGGTEADAARQIGDLDDAYPEPSMFGRTPAWGVWTRHVKGLKLVNVEMDVTAPDSRPQTVFQNTEQAE